MFSPNAPHGEIKQGLLSILPDYSELENENPYVHVRAFEEMIDSFYAQNVIETAKLRFFPFSLKDKVKGWLYTLKLRSIRNWGEMTQEFYKKFFPSHKVQQVKRKISSFVQENDETLFMAWERFKYTYNFCPTDGYDTWKLISYFYEGLQPRDRQFVQVACGDQNRSSTTTSGGSVFKLREEDNLSAKISLLTKEIEALKLKGSRGVNAIFREEPMEACRICQEIDHTTSDCKSLSQFLNVPEEHVFAFNQYRPNNSSYSNNYNPNMRNHPYLSYKSDNVLNPPPLRNNFASSSSSSRPPLEDVLGTFMQKQSEQNQRFETIFTRKDEEVVTILRSGKVIGKEIEKGIPKANEKSKETQAEKVESGTPKVKKVEKCPIPTPFSHALRLPKNLDVTAEILEHLHQVKVNLTLLHIIKQMPTYAKVIKDLCTVKRKHHLKKTAFLAEQMSFIIQHKVLPKYKDPGCPTISCIIGEYLVKRALLDLRASINLIPFTVYQQIELSDLKPISITLQLADRSVRTLRGMVKDVLIKIENFYYPVDFIILDIEPTLHLDNGIPIILVRPFLATTNTLINCKNGRMKITFGSMTAELNIFNVMQQQLEDDECHYVNLIDTVVQEEFNQNCFSDPLETLLTNSVDSYDIAHDAHLTEICSLLDSSQVLEKEQVIAINEPWRPHFEELPKTEKKPLPSSEDIPQLEVKPLPNGFKYAYLGPDETFLVVISAALNEEHESKLLYVLKDHKLAIGWTIANIKGISPLICTHKIYLEDDCKTSKEPQCRLNPTMEDVLKNEVIKLLDAGIIYPISDSKWVSPTQVVPKKSGITVVKNANDELISTHLVTGVLKKALVLNWEKCHFMVTSGIMLGHVVSSKGIEEFNIEIKNKKGVENVVVDHLSRLTFEEVKEEIPIRDCFSR
uniref:Retrotransposon gag domain-containing protein n=1 Tax=Fagus sylvatica TaxID=28930 RepID=A0A2N9EKE0_FAGSY